MNSPYREAAIEAAGRKAFRSDNGGSLAPLGETERKVTAEMLEAARPHERAAWREELEARFNDPEIAQVFRAQMPSGVRGSTINTIVALRAALRAAFDAIEGGDQ